MASIEAFEDHCWKDVIPAHDLKLYAPYARQTQVGPKVAFLAIDLYNLVYRGGARQPVDLDPQFPNSCGIYAHRAVEPTKRLFAAVRRHEPDCLVYRPHRSTAEPTWPMRLITASITSSRPSCTTW